MIQLQFCQKAWKGGYLARCILTAEKAAINNFNMDKERLVVTRAWATKGSYLKVPYFHAKGRMSLQKRYRCHLNVWIEEIPPVAGEVRLGRHGPSHAVLSKKQRNEQEKSNELSNE